jgi:serpin B
MNRKGFAGIAIALVVVIVLLIVGGVWYYYGARPLQNYLSNPPAPTSTIPTSSSQASSTSVANNQFAIDLYSRYANEKGANENVFFSPFSISSAMAMVYEGAKGQTAQEIGNVFHFPADIATLRSGYQNAFESINNNSSSYTLSTANALWVQNDYQLLPSYTNAVQTYYGGSITNLDFANDPSVAASTINQWVASRTANKIQNILSPSDVTPATRLILTNAIYFKGAWSAPFEEAATQNKDFTTGSDTISQVPIMEQTTNFAYADVGGAQILQLPYEGDDVSMFILLPKNNDLPTFEKNLRYQNISDWEGALQDQLVDVSMPKFKIETQEQMSSDLEAMGMPTAFSPTAADLSGMAAIANPSQNLYISAVIHKAFIDTDENGTEAAAATAIVIARATAVSSSRPTPVIFNANHPFMFFIQENKTGNILFVGRVVNP